MLGYFYCCRYPRSLHSFPTRRSSDLLSAQYPGRYAVDDQTDDGDENSPVERNRDRMDKAIDAFDHHVQRSEEHTSELQSRGHLVCRLLLEKKNKVAETELAEVQQEQI